MWTWNSKTVQHILLIFVVILNISICMCVFCIMNHFIYDLPSSGKHIDLDMDRMYLHGRLKCYCYNWKFVSACSGNISLCWSLDDTQSRSAMKIQHTSFTWPDPGAYNHLCVYPKMASCICNDSSYKTYTHVCARTHTHRYVQYRGKNLWQVLCSLGIASPRVIH